MSYLPLTYNGSCNKCFPFTCSYLNTCKPSYKSTLILLGILALCCIIYLSKTSYLYEPTIISSFLQNKSKKNVTLKRFNKFIFPISNRCSGLGNQMFRIAAMYGMGVYPNVKRSPGISFFNSCAEEYIEELSATFPNVVEISEIIVSSIEESLYKKYFYRI